MAAKKIFICVFSAFACLLSGACNKKNPANSEPPEEETVQRAVKLASLDEETAIFLQDKKIAVVLAHNFNDEDVIDSVVSCLEKNYGVFSDGQDGLVKYYVFPEDFTVSGRVRVSSLFSLLKDEKLAALITVGAPENLYSSIARLEDESENSSLEYPVIQLFPQDDILGTEAVSKLVLDFTRKPETMAEEESSVEINFDVNEILANAIDLVIAGKGQIARDGNLLAAAQKIAGDAHKVSHFVDSETGLKSINHFTFE